LAELGYLSTLSRGGGVVFGGLCVMRAGDHGPPAAPDGHPHDEGRAVRYASGGSGEVGPVEEPLRTDAAGLPRTRAFAQDPRVVDLLCRAEGLAR